MSSMTSARKGVTRALPMICAAMLCAGAAGAQVTLPAQLNCTFSMECLGTEPCADTQFQMTLTVEERAKSALVTLVRATMETDAETRELTGFWDGATMSVNGGGLFPTSHTVTTDLPGAALYTVHIGTDLPITYFGVCN